MHTRNRGWALSVTLVVLACGGQDQQSNGGGSGPALGPLECPHYWSRAVVRGSQIGFDTLTGDTSIVPLAGATLNVPEYHDCQRVMVPDSTRRELTYGALVAVFTSARIRNLFADQAAATASAGGLLRAVAAATVYAVDSGYAPLGLERGFNCLYLWRHSDGHAARMVPVGDDDAACQTPFDPTSALGKALEVRVGPAGNHAASSRLHWSADRVQHYVGILCGAQWCQIGDPGFVSAPPPAINAEGLAGVGTWVPDPTVAAIPVSALRAMVTTQGWYDDQYLAETTAPVLSGLHAVIIPRPGLADLVFSPGDWRTAAVVWIPEPAVGSAIAATADRYTAKFNYRPGFNAISYCRGTAAECGATGISASCMAVNTAKGEERLWGRVDSPGNATKLFCVRGRLHGTLPVPGTARWRWTIRDETSWTACIHGCCEVEN